MSEPESTAGRPGISLEQTRAAALAWLSRTGQLPSVRELRSKLGDTGSLSAIGRRLQTICANQLSDGETRNKGSAGEVHSGPCARH